jgi:tellurite resistance protein
MVLDTRLKKLAKGVSAREAARAHARSLIPGESLTDREQSQADEFRATIEAMFLMAAVDGEISTDEVAQLGASIQAIADMHAVEGMKLDETLEELNKKLARDGWNGRLEAVSQRITTDEGRSFAFRLAAGVAFIDDHVAHAEAAAIDALASALGLSSDESQAILLEVNADLFGEGPEAQ